MNIIDIFIPIDIAIEYLPILVSHIQGIFYQSFLERLKSGADPPYHKINIKGHLYILTKVRTSKNS